MTTNLQHYDEHNKAYGQGIGASKLKQILWFICSVLFVRNPLHPFSCVRKWTLQLFGAKIGEGTIIRSGVQIKYPWKLKLGNHVWIGENSWIDNLARVDIGDHACVSQGAMLCTGNHNYHSPGFELIAKPSNAEKQRNSSPGFNLLNLCLRMVFMSFITFLIKSFILINTKKGGNKSPFLLSSFFLNFNLFVLNFDGVGFTLNHLTC